MAPNARSAKRARVQDGDSSSELEHAVLKHDDEFWFDDGNLILVARDTGFKIYRGLLAAQSSVFADMFALPQPSSPEASSSDSCAHFRRQDIVHVDDPHQDLRHILKALLPSQRSK